MELLHARPRVALLALAAGASLCLLGLAAPAAADAADYPTAIDPASLQLTTASIVNNGDGVIHREEAVRITGAWHVADGAKAGDTFGMTLPSVFAGTGVSFDLLAPDGVAVATCVVPAAAAEMTCTLALDLRPDAGTAGYVGDGVFTVWVQAVGETVEESVGFVIGGVEFEIDLPGEGGIIGPWGVSDWPGKYGWEAGGRIGWSITIPEWWAAEHSWRIDGENPDSRAFFMVTDTLADGMVPTNIWWIDSTRVSDASVSVPLNQWCDDPITETSPKNCIIAGWGWDGVPNRWGAIIAGPFDADSDRVFRFTFMVDPAAAFQPGDTFLNTAYYNQTEGIYASYVYVGGLGTAGLGDATPRTLTASGAVPPLPVVALGVLLLLGGVALAATRRARRA